MCCIFISCSAFSYKDENAEIESVSVVETDTSEASEEFFDDTETESSSVSQKTTIIIKSDTYKEASTESDGEESLEGASDPELNEIPDDSSDATATIVLNNDSSDLVSKMDEVLSAVNDVYALMSSQAETTTEETTEFVDENTPLFKQMIAYQEDGLVIIIPVLLLILGLVFYRTFGGGKND